MIPILPTIATFLVQSQHAFIGLRLVQTHRPLRVLNRLDQTVLVTVAACDAVEVGLAAAAAQVAFDVGPGETPPDQRSRVLQRLPKVVGYGAGVFVQPDALAHRKPSSTARDVNAVWSARHPQYFTGWPDKTESTVIRVNMLDRRISTGLDRCRDRAAVVTRKARMNRADWLMPPTAPKKVRDETRMAQWLLANTVWANCRGETDAASSFCGIKQSGYRRKMGRDALALYFPTKGVRVA
jgi:acyl-CoA reductase-like NAD-dependent aldehyde dehydrogenase